MLQSPVEPATVPTGLPDGEWCLLLDEERSRDGTATLDSR